MAHPHPGHDRARPQSRADHLERATGAALAELTNPGWRLNHLGDRPAFVNLTRRHLLNHQAINLPPSAAVLEILEDIELDDEVDTAITHLAGRGFRLALDDLTWTPRHHHALPHVRYVKIDVLQPDWAAVEEVMDHCRPHQHIQFIAERIETKTTYRRCLHAGFTLFQGHLLARPTPLTRSAATTPGTHRITDRITDEGHPHQP